MTDQASCDICGAMIDKPDGYQLTTQQVVRSPRFWRDYYERNRQEFVAMGISSYDDLRLSPKRATGAEEIAGEEAPWLVCKRCIQLFDVDRAQAKAQQRISSRG